jgi:hypothetical protein
VHRAHARGGTWAVSLAIGGHGKAQRAARQPVELWTAPVPSPAGRTRARGTMTGLPEPLTVTTDEHCP